MDTYGETDLNVSKLRGPPILRAKQYIKINNLLESAKEKCVPYDRPPLKIECNSVEGGEQEEEEEEEFVLKAWNLRPRKPLKPARKLYALRRAKNVKKEALGLSPVVPSPDSTLPFEIDSDTEEEEPIRRKMRSLKDIYDSTKCASYNYPKQDD